MKIDDNDKLVDLDELTRRPIVDIWKDQVASEIIGFFWPQIALIAMSILVILFSLSYILRTMMTRCVHASRKPLKPYLRTFFAKKPTIGSERSSSYEWEIVPIQRIHNNVENLTSCA